MAIDVEAILASRNQINIPKGFASGARLGSQADYEELYRRSIEEPEAFWSEMAKENLHWFQDFTQVLDWQLPHARWFADGTTNISYNCLDRHLSQRGDKAAIVWVGEPGDRQELSFKELHQRVSRFAAGLTKIGVQKGDRVAIYMPMVVEAAVAMLACTRIGAIHSVVFAGFSADSLGNRILDAGATTLLTSDGCYRRGKPFALGEIVDGALAIAEEQSPGLVQRVVQSTRIEQGGTQKATHEFLEVEELGAQGMDAVPLAAEHPSFILYTSGTTGKPKGIQHSTGGYLLGTHLTTKYIFDVREDDVYWCTADVGWITGHSYVLYGALSNGCTTVMYEGTPNTPDWGRFWQLIEQEKISILYTAPTAIRAFMQQGDAWPEKYDLSSLRLLGSVGEPINPAAWEWYFDKIGGGQCPVVDTWWQTETGSICMTTLPGVHSMKPGAAGYPFFGIQPYIGDEHGAVARDGEGGYLGLKRPWPSMVRTIWGDDERFVQQYWSFLPEMYTTGDGAVKDLDGFTWLLGRVDDVINVSGHRIGTIEVESSLVAHPKVSEAAVVGRDHEIKGQALACFVIGDAGVEDVPDLVQKVAQDIGAFSRPDDVFVVPDLPKTRSGKIMRRVLRAIAEGRDVGDLTTLNDPAAVQAIVDAVAQQRKKG